MIETCRVDNELIPKVEEAMGFTFTPEQRKYLEGHFNTVMPGKVRQVGRTTTYMIKLALDGMIIDFSDVENLKEYIDRDRSNIEYAYYFEEEFVKIHKTLKEAGLPVGIFIPRVKRNRNAKRN